MGITLNLYDAPFYLGSGSSSQVPAVFNVSLNGRPYIIDFSQPFYRQYRRQISPLLRSQADVGTQPGEQSINPEDLWRRSQDDWSLGAGQNYLDRRESLPNRFRRSKGINVWDKWAITLLSDTANIYASAATNLFAISAGPRVYITDGIALKYTTDITVAVPVWTTVTGTPGSLISSITTDGYNVWFATTAGIYVTNTTISTCSALVTSTLTTTALVSFLKGRLMVADGPAIYNITSTSPATLPTPLFTHSNSTFQWVSFADGQTDIYIGGFSGDHSYIYGIAIVTDGTTLNPPIQQGELPPGETLLALYGSTGFLFLGSNLGVRFASTDSSGAVTVQSLIPTPQPVRAITSYSHFVYFAWTNYDLVSTGLGRMDLANFAISGSQPAYASDLMTSHQGDIQAIVTFQGQPMFSVRGFGYFTSTANLVASGSIDSGWILYDLPDIKIALQLLVQSPVPLPSGSFQSYVSADDGAFIQVGTHGPTDDDPVRFSVPQLSAQRFEVRTVLLASTTTPSISPSISRYTLRSWPAPRRPITWQLPLILNESTVNISGSTDGFNPIIELQALEDMAASGLLVNYQEGGQSYPVLVTDVEFLPDYLMENRAYFNGIALVQLKGVPT